MFSLEVVDTDAFLEMPASTQALYFHLGMRADDDGFVSSPRKITTMVNCGQDDLKLLIAKEFIIPVGDGIIVIKHWKINNYIQKDRYTKTQYSNELEFLECDSNGAYSLAKSTETDTYTNCIHDVSKTDTQVRLDKSKDSIEEDRESRGVKWSATPAATHQDPFDFRIVQKQITQMYGSVNNAASFSYNLSEVIEVFMLYYSAYQRHLGQHHPQLKNEDVLEIIGKIPSCTSNEGDRIDLDVSVYEAVIEKHFEADYQGQCDYSMIHFMSGQIRALRYFEITR